MDTALTTTTAAAATPPLGLSAQLLLAYAAPVLLAVVAAAALLAASSSSSWPYRLLSARRRQEHRQRHQQHQQQQHQRQENRPGRSGYQRLPTHHPRSEGSNEDAVLEPATASPAVAAHLRFFLFLVLLTLPINLCIHLRDALRGEFYAPGAARDVDALVACLATLCTLRKHLARRNDYGFTVMLLCGLQAASACTGLAALSLQQVQLFRAQKTGIRTAFDWLSPPAARFLLPPPADRTGLVAVSIMQLFFSVPLAVIALVVHPLTRSRPRPNEDTSLHSPTATGTSSSASNTSTEQRGSFELALYSVSRIRKLFPFLWPKAQPGLQILLVLTFLQVGLGRVVAVLLPIQNKLLINSLGIHAFAAAALQVLIFCMYKFLQSGLLTNLQNACWAPVGLYITRSASVRMLHHLHNLSLHFHLNRRTGEILRVLDRGTSSIVALTQMIFLTLLPVIADACMAVGFFMFQFDVYFGVTVMLTLVAYIYATVSMTEWRIKLRRETNDLDNRANQISVDSLTNVETVKYFTSERYEQNRYDKALMAYCKSDLKSTLSLCMLNIVQTAITTIGLLVGAMLCAYRVSEGNYNIGDFVLFYSYMTQLQQPLNFLGTMYRIIQQNFTDLEKMLALFDERADVTDAPNARDLVLAPDPDTGVCGTIEFRDVYFSYRRATARATSPTAENEEDEGDDDNNNEITEAQSNNSPMALRGLSFFVPAGKTIALVGESGSGKTTAFRLLFRFFDVQRGAILIDGQDIRTVTQNSLRRAIGVVPQDIVLFNDTVRYNVSYGRHDAPLEEVYAAARAAQIHTRIESFAQGYNTVVGERGLRLSGGERQRIAVARAIVKDPRIIAIDEGTSALDSHTEQMLQRALQALCKNRTTLVIAHRLSTIQHADVIVVMGNGRAVEQGTHDYLIAKRGAYFDLWNKQQQAAPTSSVTSASTEGTPTNPAITISKDVPFLNPPATKDNPVPSSSSKGDSSASSSLTAGNSIASKKGSRSDSVKETVDSKSAKKGTKNEEDKDAKDKGAKDGSNKE